MKRSDPQPRYPIGTVSRRTGLSPHVLRAWERRYGAVEPARGGAGERLYSDADISRFRLLHRLTRAGHPIGRIARLPTPELVALAPEEGDDLPAVRPAPSARGERYLDTTLRALTDLDAEQLNATLTRAVVELSSRELIDGLLRPLLRRVGELWQDGRICPAHEHLLSVRVARVLGWLADAISVPEGAPVAVAGTPSGQRHEFGALLASIIAAEEGWRVIYLGPDLPARDIATAAEVHGARAVLLSAVLREEPSSLASEVREIRTAVGGEPHVLVGGSGATPHRHEIEQAGGSWVPDFTELRTMLRGIHSAQGDR